MSYEIFDLRTGKELFRVPRLAGRIISRILIACPWLFPHLDVAELNS